MRPRLPKAVANCLLKARESALLAVEVYNKPATKFKSGGYVVLMCIAWTSLLHAVFLKKKIKPIYKEKNSRRYKRVDGELQFWELKTCVSKYFTDTQNPIRKNIEFFIPLRNKIEHKFMPEIDSVVFAECQALLLNFDKVIEKEFGVYNCISESLSFALQMFPSQRFHYSSVQSKKDTLNVIDWINNYRSSISTDIINSGEYAFKAFLIQVANHDSSECLPIQFIAFDKLTDDEKRNVSRVAALVKSKKVSVANANLLNPGEVVQKVQEGLGNPKVTRGKKQVDKFNLDTHTRCWKRYNVRPGKKDPHPELTNNKYCVYDERNENYGYTVAWVDFLIDKMQDEHEYNSLFN